MAMSGIEIVEEDCGCESGLSIKVLNEEHLKTLVGKYWNEGYYGEDWHVLTGEEKHLIGQHITIRSPMTCKTENFKICKKCFGEKRTRTPYVGVIAGQCITERLTQLLLRSFHTSGSCELSLNIIVSNFIKDHLIDLQRKDDLIVLVFDTDKIPSNFSEIQGYTETKDNTVIYDKIRHKIINDDTLLTVEKIREILRKNDKITKTPSEYYCDLVECVLSVGGIYSSYIEMVLAHIFMVDNNNFWRYNQDKQVTIKLSEKTIAVKISPLLGFLYQPNRISIKGIEDDHLLKNIPDDNNLSFHEKIFLQKF